MQNSFVKKQIITLDQVLPHRDTMRWLDRLLSHDENTVIAEAWVRESHVLAVDQGVPAWAGIEYMAQAIATWAGCRALAKNEPIKIGFLLGTRKAPLFIYSSSRLYWPWCAWSIYEDAWNLLFK